MNWNRFSCQTSVSFARQLYLILRLFGVTLVFLFASSAYAASDQVTEKQLQQLKTDIGKLNQWLAKASRDETDQIKKLKTLERGISESSVRAEQLKKQMSRLEGERKILSQRRANVEKNVLKQKKDMAALLLASYKAGEKNTLKLLFDNNDPVYWLRMLNYSQSVSSVQTKTLTAYQDSLQEMQRIQSSLNIKLQEHQIASLKLVKQQQDLRRQKNDRAQVLANLRKEILSAGQKLENMKSDRARLESLLVKVVEAIENLVPGDMSQPFSRRKGKVDWPAKGRLTQRFGSKIGNGPLKSQGIVVSVAAQASIKAVHHGRVVFSDWLNGFGLLLIIDHGDGYMSLYSRNEVLMRSVGEWVTTGDLIAKSGDSGLDEQGLYFEIRYKGKPQNPLVWLAKR